MTAPSASNFDQGKRKAEWIREAKVFNGT